MYRTKTVVPTIESSFFKLPDTLLLVFDRQWHVTLVSDAWTAALGYSPEEIRNSTFLNLLHIVDQGECERRLMALDADNPTLRFPSRCQRKDGSYLGVAWNVRFDAETELFYASAHETALNLQGQDASVPDALLDGLTGVPNRSLFIERLQHTQHRVSRRHDMQYAILYCGIDRFKVINQSLGHRYGDLLLVAIANLLYSTIRPTDMAARMAGDEFALLLEDIRDISSTLHVVNRIQQKLTEPLLLDEKEVYCSVSFGIVAGSEKNPEDLLGDANIAMIRAKAMGGSAYVVFDKHMHDQAIHRLQMEMDLRKAVEREEFEAYFQPIVCLDSQKTSGFEALVRWNHPENGLISPIHFIPVAEETGMIIQIGRWMLFNACQTLVEWNKKFASETPLTVSVNLAARQLQSPTLCEDVAEALQRSGLAPHLLKLEITESGMMANPDQAIEVLKKLRAMGVLLMLDDFGTGYSSLSYLHRLPINTLKVDRSFISNIQDRENDRHFVETIVTLVHKLGHTLVCEGIELACQADILADIGVEYGQGFLYAKPLKKSDAEAWLLDQGMWLATPAEKTVASFPA